MKGQYSVITGAAKGLGRAFAYALAKRKINTLLIDLPGTGLAELCKEIRYISGTDSVCFEQDLTIKDSIVELSEKINREYEVFILINNVGAGGAKRFDKVDVDYINRMIQLNVMATSVMTHQLIPNLKRQDKSYILNVASMASFSPMGYKTVYPATKAFIRYFSRGLCQEFRKTNIFVSVVCPGPMKTNADVTKRIESQSAIGHFGVVSPEKVAEISIRRLFKKDKMIIANFANRVNWLIMKILPGCIRLPLVSRIMRREAEMGDD
ncbi:MAG: SDR family NAD(P)-dependent oxidoreductase [Bacteroidales bacterium]|nr:SDR family NAD(P)-dependent oxidoreductase [Bacteroidales bacterium]